MYCCSLWYYAVQINDDNGDEVLTMKLDGGLGGLLQAPSGHSGFPCPRGSLSSKRRFSVQLRSRV